MPEVSPIILYPLIVWTYFWKGLALWLACENNQRNWFIAILVINSLGIVELAYLFIFAKKKFDLKKLKFWQTR